jgi:biotin carboxylase
MKRILVLGASRYYIQSILAARKAGFFVIVVDKNPHAEGFKVADEYQVCDIIDSKAVLQVANKYKIDGIIPLNDYGVPVAAYVSKILNLPGIDEQSAYWATDKAAMREQWVKMGVPCPQVLIGTSELEIIEAIEQIGFPCILKPAHGIGGGSRGVIVVNQESEVLNAIRFSQQFYSNKTTLVESFVISEYEHSAEVLIYDNQPHVIAIGDKIKTSLPYRVDKNVLYPTIIKGDRLQLLKTQIINAVKALNLNIGSAHVELASTKDGFVLFELGARCGGGGTPTIVHYSTQIDEFVESVRILTGDAPTQINPLRNLGCNYHFLTFKEGQVKSIEGLEMIKANPNVLDAEIFINSGDTIMPVKTGLNRSGFIIVGCETREAAYEIGLELESQIKVNYHNERILINQDI